MKFLLFLSLPLTICIGTIFGTLADEQMIVGWTIFHPVILVSIIIIWGLPYFLYQKQYYRLLMLLGFLISCGSLLIFYLDIQFSAARGYPLFGPMMPFVIAIVGVITIVWAWQRNQKIRSNHKDT